MTTTNVNSFVGDLVKMAQAFDELPKVQEALEAERAAHNADLERIAEREASILHLKQQLEALQAQLSKTEADRDDAVAKFCEADDRLTAFRHLVTGFASDATSLVKASEPQPEPQPVTSGETKADEPTVQESNKTVTAQPQPQGQSATGESEAGSGASTEGNATPTGASEPVSAPSHPDLSGERAQGEPMPSPSDATQAKAPEPVDGSAPSTVSQPEPAPLDDVGYHNEPSMSEGWSAWEAWSNRMDARYGTGRWPARPQPAGFGFAAQ